MSLDFKEMLKEDARNVFMNPKEFGSLHMVAVSYTHLDVYKRQFQYIAWKTLGRSRGTPG